MHTLGDISKRLNRVAVYVSGLQARFELPALEGTAYSNAYLEFLRTLKPASIRRPRILSLHECRRTGEKPL